MAFDTLPDVTVSWNAAAAATPPDVFAQYNVYRQIAGEVAATRIAVITNIATVSFVDQECPSGAVATYSLTQSVWHLGALVESVAATASTTLGFKNIFLHSVLAPTNYVQMHGRAVNLDPLGNVVFKPVAGKQAPIAFIGSEQWATFSVSDRPHLWTDMLTWAALTSLLTLQRTLGYLYCLRVGYSGDKIFCTIDGNGVKRVDQPGAYTPSLTVTQVDFSEAV